MLTKNVMEFSVKIHPDADGYTGRECPVCKKYFKIKFGTGLPGAVQCHCPYCNHVGPQTEFWTEQQLEYAKSVALNQMTKQLLGSLKQLERRPDPGAFISIGITVKGQPTPIARYSETELEERITCAACTLEYTIYGTFGYCPDCGIHNSLQILNANFDLTLKILDLAASAADEVKAKLIENALEDAVSAFDGYGREHCSKLSSRISFQNIASARGAVLRETGKDIAERFSTSEWHFVCDQFQKRHLLAHKMGIIDQEFVAKTDCSPALLGRKVSITSEDVQQLIRHLAMVAEDLFNKVPRD